VETLCVCSMQHNDKVCNDDNDDNDDDDDDAERDWNKYIKNPTTQFHHNAYQLRDINSK